MQLPIADDQLDPSSEAVLELDQLIEGDARFNQHDRMLYSTDASMYQVEPVGVVVPATINDVQITMDWCARHGLAILPRGGGTSLAGQTVNRAVVIDCSSRLRSIGPVDVDRRRVDVESGVVLDAIQEAARPHGLRFGPEVSTSSHATIGGMISNRSAGLHSRRWGMTDAHVLGVDIVSADGSSMRLEKGAACHDRHVAELTRQVAEVVLPLSDVIDQRYPKLTRNVGGYALDRVLAELRSCEGGDYSEVNLSGLIAGSEGSLGVITGASLSLVEDPPVSALAVLAFPDVSAALAALVPILESDPSAVELLDHTILKAARDRGTYSHLLNLLPSCGDPSTNAVLYVDWLGDTEEEVAAGLGAISAMLPDVPCRVYTDSDRQRDLWHLRKVGLGLIMSGDGGGQPAGGLEDCAVAPEHLASFQKGFEKMLGRHGLSATYYAHASVGLLHIRPRINLRTSAGRSLLEELGREATKLVLDHGGTVSGEHGDGRIRAAMTHEFYGPELVEAFRRIKTIFDPDCRLNPGMITSDPGMTTHLRVMPEAKQSEDSAFRWPESAAEAASQCNGNGFCRRMEGGAMCPSYRATLDERHSTRGRANALRLAMTGQLGDGDSKWGDEETLETLDLCLGCKACRYECPAAVDVASLKSEYLHQTYQRAGGAPWRTRVKANIRQLNRIGSRLHPISTFLIQRSPVAWIIKRMLGIAPSRTMPGFSASLLRWHERRDQKCEGPVVILYADCFTTWSESVIGRDAVRLLEAFGYQTVMANAGCCGRTACSAGLLDDAARQIASSARSLHASMKEHDAIGVLALEPSCLTSLQQEWRELITDVPHEVVEEVAAAASSVEAFLLNRWDEHPQLPEFLIQEGDLPVHQHCHQKQSGEITAAFLRRCGWPGAVLKDTGCCGMAGSFGYEVRHESLSRRVAEDSLSCLDGCAGPVAANGTSCRHQIWDVKERGSVHPVSLAAERLSSC